MEWHQSGEQKFRLIWSEFWEKSGARDRSFSLVDKLSHKRFPRLFTSVGLHLPLWGPKLPVTILSLAPRGAAILSTPVRVCEALKKLLNTVRFCEALGDWRFCGRTESCEMDIFTPEERRKTLKILSNLRRVSPSLFHTLFLSLSMLRRSRVAWSPLWAWRAGLWIPLSHIWVFDWLCVPIVFSSKNIFWGFAIFLSRPNELSSDRSVCKWLFRWRILRCPLYPLSLMAIGRNVLIRQFRDASILIFNMNSRNDNPGFYWERFPFWLPIWILWL